MGKSCEITILMYKGGGAPFKCGPARTCTNSLVSLRHKLLSTHPQDGDVLRIERIFVSRFNDLVECECWLIGEVKHAFAASRKYDNGRRIMLVEGASTCPQTFCQSGAFTRDTEWGIYTIVYRVCLRRVYILIKPVSACI